MNNSSSLRDVVWFCRLRRAGLDFWPYVVANKHKSWEVSIRDDAVARSSTLHHSEGSLKNFFSKYHDCSCAVRVIRGVCRYRGTYFQLDIKYLEVIFGYR